MRTRPWLWTACGAAAGVLAIAAWLATFDPHGGVDWSPWLFPLSSAALERRYPFRSVPVPLFYASALLQWIVANAAVDLLRRARGARRATPRRSG